MTSSKTDIVRKAQAKYCNDNGYPLFAPWDGLCFRCGMNIYDGERSWTLEMASDNLVTYCPHCNYSFVD